MINEKLLHFVHIHPIIIISHTVVIQNSLMTEIHLGFHMNFVRDGKIEHMQPDGNADTADLRIGSVIS